MLLGSRLSDASFEELLAEFRRVKAMPGAEGYAKQVKDRSDWHKVQIIEVAQIVYPAMLAAWEKLTPQQKTRIEAAEQLERNAERHAGNNTKRGKLTKLGKS